MKPRFHRDGRVTVQGKAVGTCRSPDPSGAPWARSLIWIFQAADGRVAQARTRSDLSADALAAYRRLTTVPTQPSA